MYVYLTYFIAACFTEMLVSAPWRWRDNSVETRRNYVKDYLLHHKAQNKQSKSIAGMFRAC